MPVKVHSSGRMQALPAALAAMCCSPHTPPPPRPPPACSGAGCPAAAAGRPGRADAAERRPAFVSVPAPVGSGSAAAAATGAAADTGPEMTIIELQFINASAASLLPIALPVWT